MPRSMWSGSISFGLVNVPVKMFSAVSQKDVRFHQIDARTQRRVRQRRVAEGSDEEVPFDQIVKGYEVGPERYVMISPDELDALDPKATKSIDIEDFVDLHQIDPLYFERPYYLVPDKGGAKAYALLVEAMKESGMVAIARVVLRTKQYLVALRALGNALVMETLYYADEVTEPDELEGLPDDVEVSDRELKIARQLIESLATEFDPEQYKDEYRERVLELIEQKAAGQEVAIERPAEQPTKVVDLMAALEASLAAVKEEKGDDADAAADEKPKRKRSSKAKSDS